MRSDAMRRHLAPLLIAALSMLAACGGDDEKPRRDRRDRPERPRRGQGGDQVAAALAKYRTGGFAINVHSYAGGFPVVACGNIPAG